MKRLIRTAAIAETTRAWFRRLLARNGIDARRCIAYTFWFDRVTVGLGLAKADMDQVVLVTRVHGADLYLDRHDPPYLPGRRATLRSLDRLFAASTHALDYVKEEYPWFGRAEVARLGVHATGFASRASDGDRFVVASCSGIVSVKRLDRVVTGLAELARQRPAIAFDWHHFGDGPSRVEVEALAGRTLPENARPHFHGHKPVDFILAFYREQPVDLFMNTSDSEGGAPVAIMEAISSGIPVIATSVGGNPDIVSSENGLLVSADPTPAQLAQAIGTILDRPDRGAELRAGSLRTWKRSFDASRNYEAFADRLVELRAAVAS
jgi:glycosyltransferase involved in cell wall biosynthesis